MKKILFILSFICSSAIAFSQLNYVNFSNQNNIQCLYEDGNFIWVGTSGGIMVRNKSNGTVAQVYTTSNGLSSNDVRKIVRDLKGNIWVATGFGVDMFDGIKWTVYVNENPWAGNDINAVAVDFNGNIWAGGYWTSLKKFDGKNWIFIDSVSAPIGSIYFDESGNMWVGTMAGLCKFNGTSWKKFTTADGLPYDYVTSICGDANGNLWLGYPGLFGITKFDGTAFSTDDIELVSTYPVWVHDITVDASGDIWAATSNGLYDYNGIAWTKYNKSSGMADDYVNACLVDVQGNKWAGTPSGLSRLDNFFWTWSTYTVSNTIINNWVNDISEDKNGNIWFATKGGISKLTSTGVWKNYTYENTGFDLFYGMIISIVPDPKFANVVWFGTPYGLGKFDGTTWTKYYNNEWISDIVFDNNGTLWASVRNISTVGGLIKYDGTWKKFLAAEGLKSNSLYSLAVDASNNLWIGSDSGVCKYNGSTFVHHLFPEIGSTGGTINAIEFDNAGKIWIAGWSAGTFSFDGTNWTNHLNFGDQGIISSVTSIKKDVLGNMWFGMYLKGIAKTDGKNWGNYPVSKGLAGMNVLCVSTDSKNNIWVGTETGVSKISCKKPNTDFIFDTACYSVKNNSSTHLINASADVDSTTHYQWDIMNNGSSDFSTYNASYKFSSYGVFPVKLIGINDFCSDTIIKDIRVNQMPVTSVSNHNISICKGQSIDLSVTIDNYDNLLFYSYSWNNGSFEPSINAFTQGEYIVSVSNEDCKSKADTINLRVLEPYDSSKICLVTVDKTTGNNKIIWERSAGKRIESYNVYKKVGSLYVPLGGVPFDSVSQFIDFTSIPEAFSHSYSISVVDSCGNESEYSPVVKTINLLTALSPDTGVIGLHWTPYEDDDFSPDNYYIYKGKTKNSMAQFAAVPGNITQYNDLNRNGAMYYQIVINKNTACAPANMKAESGPYTQSLSNIAEYKTGLSFDPASMISASLYPNPFNETATLEYFLEESTDVFIEYYNSMGLKTAESLFRNETAGKHSIKVNSDEKRLMAGINVIKITAGSKTTVIRCVFSGK